ncbi:hypothetical protein FN846DRAFT_914167 [Sphaerosporella brunnea]|uniref:Uncharacterized protein n=1 Tax=Sphaerosporella brunnea TaxID=1250544 RepID=A0A5J5EDI8_9PEZI|nr:hypothetical protein FN846DRAFT_914167 [Sphaerosporella brunnea]
MGRNAKEPEGVVEWESEGEEGLSGDERRSSEDDGGETKNDWQGGNRRGMATVPKRGRGVQARITMQQIFLALHLLLRRNHPSPLASAGVICAPPAAEEFASLLNGAKSEQKTPGGVQKTTAENTTSKPRTLAERISLPSKPKEGVRRARRSARITNQGTELVQNPIPFPFTTTPRTGAFDQHPPLPPQRTATAPHKGEVQTLVTKEEVSAMVQQMLENAMAEGEKKKESFREDDDGESFRSVERVKEPHGDTSKGLIDGVPPPTMVGIVPLAIHAYLLW